MQPTLPGMQSSHEARDPLGRRYTPDPLAAACLRRIHLTPGPETWIVDGHVGGGAFPRQAKLLWPGVRVLGVDIDPTAPGFEFCDEHVVGDWERCAAELMEKFHWPWVVGNPPFDDPRGGDPDRAQRHLRATMAAAQGRAVPVSWILPLAYLGTSAWNLLLRRFPPSSVAPITGRPWGEFVRETANYLWVGSRDCSRLTANDRKVGDGWHVGLDRPIDDWD